MGSKEKGKDAKEETPWKGNERKWKKRVNEMNAD
jgi:hypothetical protein